MLRSAAALGLTFIAAIVLSGIALGTAWGVRYIHAGPWHDGWDDRYMIFGLVLAAMLSLGAAVVGSFFIITPWVNCLKRDDTGLCPRCGYDLRAQRADDITCPECGAVTR